MSMATLAVIVLVFIVLSGIMAAVDAAILSVTRPEVHELLLHGERGANALRLVKEDLTRGVIVIVIATNAVNVLGPIVASQFALHELGPRSLPMLTAVLTVGSILFAEIIPKALGNRYAPEIGRIAAPVLRLSQHILFPFVLCFEWISRGFTKGTLRW